MMTMDEIQAATINPDVAREAYAQAEKRLEDALTTKASHEQKAFALMAAYIAVALALFTVSGALATSEPTIPGLVAAFLLAGAIFTVGAVIAVLALLDQTYGALGSAPSMWLRPGVIDGGETALPAMLAYVTFFHQTRIDESATANRHKATLVRVATYVGVVAPFVLCVWLAVVAWR